MIDIDKAKREFMNYVKNYNYSDYKIKLKIEHSFRVSTEAKNIAFALKLSQEDINLAELIGLLHDIGRFEQVKRFGTFLDNKSIDHADLGVKILFKDEMIKKFVEETDKQYYEIIKRAISNHNKVRIEEKLSERELLHSKIIRDADKIDIFHVIVTSSIKEIYGKEDLSKEKITNKIFEDFKKERFVHYNKMETNLDLLIAHIAYIYNFYFDYSLKTIYDRKDLENLCNKFNFENEKTEKEFKYIYYETKRYIKNRLHV